MTSLTHRGLIYRTKLMTTEAAWRFATCLMANDRFEQVAMVHSSKAKGAARYFVQFVPTSPERQEAMVQRQQDAREERAAVEGDGYTFCLDKNGGRAFFWCLSVSGEVYEVEPHGRTCSCPDFTFRCAATGLVCKHLIALESGKGRCESFSAPQPAATAEERKAAARADIASLGL